MNIAINFIHYIKIYSMHLWLSISSAKFYHTILNQYSGYGLRYIFNLCCIASLMYSVYTINLITDVKNYLSNGVVTDRLTKLNYIEEQLPPIHYDGNSISTVVEMPYYIDNTIVIDTDKEANYLKYSNIPLVLMSDVLVLNLLNPKSPFIVEYDKILGTDSMDLDKTKINKVLVTKLSNVERIIIYLATPISALLLFLKTLFFNVTSVVVIYCLCKLFKLNLTIKQLIRAVLYSIGSCVLVEPIISFFSIPYIYILFQLWPKLLLVNAIIRTRNLQNSL